MKINETGRIGAYRSYQPAAEPRESKASGKKSKDEVKFSAEAMELLQARKGADEAERLQRIEQLKNEVSAGTYRVPDHLLAEKLLPFLRDVQK